MAYKLHCYVVTDRRGRGWMMRAKNKRTLRKRLGKEAENLVIRRVECKTLPSDLKREYGL